jgi:hypothetical protein
MNINNIFNEIEKVDPEVYDKMDDRRAALKNLTGLAGKVAAVSFPFLLGSMFKKAYGQTSTTVVDTLNFALTLEFLEAEFYKRAVTTGIIPAADLAGFTSIRDHEVAHVAFLRTAIQGAGGTPVSFTFASFDFTAKGAFPTVFTNYDTLLAVSQAFEDTGVRAYKGQAGNLMSNKAVLTAALQIHSVEARHAAYIRRLRRNRGANVKPWVTGNDTGGIAGIAAVYAGEENTLQAGVQITGINGAAVSTAAASESFDEPLTRAQVTTIITPFLA